MVRGRTLYALIFITVVSFVFSGCAAIPISLAMQGAADAGMELASRDSRSFTHTKAQVKAATLEALERMQISVARQTEKKESEKIIGKTKKLSITIILAAITPKLTKVSVRAKRNWFSRDETVSAEILVQINRILRREFDPSPRTPAGA